MTSNKRDPRPQNDQGPTPSQPHDTGQSMSYEALNAAFHKLPIFPVYPTNDGVCTCAKGHLCDKPGRHPIAPGGVAEATDDMSVASRSWKEWPNAAIGVATGRANGFIVYDPRQSKGDGRSFEDLVRRYGPAVDGSQSPLLVQTFSAWASEVDAEPNPGWIAKPVWPGDAYGVMAAESKVGKTWAQLDLAISVATGTNWMNVFPTQQGTVVVFLGEGDERNTVRRVRAILAGRGLTKEDLGGRLHLCFRVPHLKNEDHIAEMERVLTETGEVRLVILDPLYLAAGGANGASLYDMAVPLEAAQRVAQRIGAALMVVHHFNQTGTGSSASRMSGAGPEEWGRVLVAVTVGDRTVSDDGRTETAYLHWEFTGSEIVPVQLTVKRTISVENLHDLTSPMSYDIEQDEAPVKQTKTIRAVTDVLNNADDWLTTAAIHDQVSAVNQVSKKTIENTLKALLNVGEAERRGEQHKGYQWQSVVPPATGSAQ